MDKNIDKATIWDISDDFFNADEAPSSNSEHSRQLRVERQRRYRLNVKNKKQARELELEKNRTELDKLQNDNGELTIIQQVQHKVLDYVDMMTSAAKSFMGGKKKQRKEDMSVADSATAVASGSRPPAVPVIRKLPGSPADLVDQLFSGEEPSEEACVWQPLDDLVACDEMIFESTAVLFANRGLLLLLAQERPQDIAKLAARRLLPLGPDGGINPKLHDLTKRWKMRPQQYTDVKKAWELYKLATGRARSRARLAVHQALANNQMTGAEVSGLCSMVAAGGLLATLQSLQILEELPLIEGSELLRYSFAFVDSLSLEQRATAMSVCVPYMPDWLQISAVLFDDDEETSNTIYAS